ncbi:hypothetical protein, partial [Paucilactobacillus suebicus]
DDDGNPSTGTDGETMTGDGTLSYTKAASADPISVDPDDYYETTTTDDPDGGTTTTTTDGHDEVTEIVKNWPDGDKTDVIITTTPTDPTDPDSLTTSELTVTETPNGEDPLTPVT